MSKWMALLSLALAGGCSADVAAALDHDAPQVRPQRPDWPHAAPSSAAPSSAGPSSAGPSSPAAPGAPVAPTADGPPYPIVLLHGMFGFKSISLVRLEYWNGIPEDLAAHGETQVFVAQAPMLASSATRAAALAPFLDDVLARTGKRKLNLIGHSQGGLDARYLVSSMGYGDRVASISTLSSPHHGSQVADAILGAAPTVAYTLLDPLLQLYGDLGGDPANDKDLHASLVALSQAYVDGTFNPQNPDDPRVAYFSWAGRSNLAAGGPDCDRLPNDASKLDVVNPLFVATGLYLSFAGAPAHAVNDGLVSVESSTWGQFMGCVPADHLDEIGQIGESGPDPLTGFDHKAFLREVVANLRAHGY